MPVTAGWIKVTKVKDDGGKTNRYAKGKGAKSKGKMTQGKSQAKNGQSKAQRVVQEEAVSSLSESEDDEESEEEAAPEGPMAARSGKRVGLLGGTFSDPLSAINGDLLNLIFGKFEYLFALYRRG